jgi:hypothetical protein
MFKKWFGSTPTKPVLPGGNTYGEPKSTYPKTPASTKDKSLENPRPGSVVSAVSNSSRDSPGKRPNTAGELSARQAPRSSPLKPDYDQTLTTPTRRLSQDVPRQSPQYQQEPRRQEPPRQSSNYVSRTSTMRSQMDGDGDGISEAGTPQVYGELEELKTRIRHLELTRRGSGMRTSQVESIPERPSTSGTMTASSRSRAVPISPLAEIRSPGGYFSKSQSLLQSALSKVEQRVSRDIYSALEAAAQDAMDLSTMSAAATTSVYSSSYVPDNPAGDKRLRRTADNLCRSLTELCIALCEDTGTPSDMRSESRMSMRRPSRDSLYQASQIPNGSIMSSNDGRTRRGSVLAARNNNRVVEPILDEGRSLAARQSAAHRRADSTSTVTNDRYDSGFRFNDDVVPADSISRSTSNAQNISAPREFSQSSRYDNESSARSRSALIAKYSNVSLRDRHGDDNTNSTSTFRVHALTSDRAETTSPRSERQQQHARQQYLQPSSQYTTSATNNNPIYELPAHRSPNDRNTDSSEPSSAALSSPGDAHNHGYPFPSAPKGGTSSQSQSSPIRIPGRSGSDAPASPDAIIAGSYSSTLTQRILERRMQQQKEEQQQRGRDDNMAASLGTSLPVQNPHSLLNGLPSSKEGRLGSMGGNRSAPRVGIAKAIGRAGDRGFGGGVTG